MYGNAHKYFLQFMLKNGNVPASQALEFCGSYTEDVNTVGTFKQFVMEINEVIANQDLKISFVKCEVTGNDQVVLLNTANDTISKLQNTFSSIETEYFQLLLKEVVIAQDHRIKNMACYNLSNSLTSTLRKENVEKLLKNWINGGYFIKNDSYLYLGARCIAEFAPYFQTHCNEYYSMCPLCSEPVFVGKCCRSCNNLMHKHCMEKYLTKQNKCPNCKVAWEEDNYKRNGDDAEISLYSSTDEENESSLQDEATCRKNLLLS